MVGPSYGSIISEGRNAPRCPETTFVAEDSDPEDRLAERDMSWVSAAWVINASVIGMGVLTIPSCLASLGWLCGLVALVFCLLANILVARIMVDIQELHPQAISLADAVTIACGGSRRVKSIFRSVLYAEKLACTCAFVNLMADTLGSAFHMVHWCEASWCGIIVIIFLPMMRVKNLKETFWMNIINFATIVAVVILTCVTVVSAPKTNATETSVFPPVSTFTEAFGAVSMMVFAFSGNWMYFELMAEMRQPASFMRAFNIAGPTQIGLYAFMGCMCYGYLGRSVPDSVVEVLHFGALMRTISVLLVLHIVCGTGTNMVVLIRFFHSRISPKDLNADTVRANVIRTMLYFLIICGTVFVSLAVGDVGTIVTLIGALFEAPINFLCPFLIYAAVMRRQSPKRDWRSYFLWYGGALIALFGIVTSVIGVTHAVANMHRGFGKGPGFLSCNCQGLWDTCECSAHRMPAGVCVQVSAIESMHLNNVPLYVHHPFH